MSKSTDSNDDAVGKSGQQMAVENVQQFRNWINERGEKEDWDDYFHRGKLSRTAIAKKCKFSYSVLYQNPEIRAELAALEERLIAEGNRDPGQSKKTAENRSNCGIDENSNQAVTRRMAEAKSAADQRIKTLEELNASLRAEIADLRARLMKYQQFENHLAETGRMMHP